MVTHVDAQVSALIPPMIHHWLSRKLDDNTKGEEACEKLAETDPEKAVKNVDSFVFFVRDAQSAPLQSTL